jgi:hypothetical protein
VAIQQAARHARRAGPRADPRGAASELPTGDGIMPEPLGDAIGPVASPVVSVAGGELTGGRAGG